MMSNPRRKISAARKRLVQEAAHRAISEAKIIRKRSESCSLCGGPSPDHMFEAPLTQKHAPGPWSSGELGQTEGGFRYAHVSKLVGMHKMQRM